MGVKQKLRNDPDELRCVARVVIHFQEESDQEMLIPPKIVPAERSERCFYANRVDIYYGPEKLQALC